MSKSVELSQGKWAIVDDEDYIAIACYKWRVVRSGDNFYAMRYFARVPAMMHRYIMNEPNGHVDHINGNSLDNRKCNLRLATVSQNAANSKRTTADSGLKGVYSSTKNTWRARICVNDNRMNLGSYRTPEEASMAYGLGALLFFKEFARLK